MSEPEEEGRHQTMPLRVLTHVLPPRVLTWRFGVFVLLLTLISLALGTKSSIDTNQNTRCLADYAKRNSEVSQARAESSTAKDTARDALLDGVTDLIAHPGKDPAAGQRKLQRLASDYQKSKRILAATRATNPLPDFPKECGAPDETPTPVPGS